MNYAPGSSVMPFDEASRISRVTVTMAHSADNYFETSHITGFDRFFFIIDELGRCSPPNSILTMIQFIIIGYQYYISFYFSFLNGIWDFSELPDKVLRYLTYPLDFGLGDSEIFTTGIVSYILLILSLLIIVYLISIYIYFHRNKMFPRHNAHITRFVFSFLIPILLPASCYNIGFSFNSIFSDQFEVFVDDNETIFSNFTIEPTTSFFHIKTAVMNSQPLFIASTVFGIILYIILMYVFYIDAKFRSSTPYLENTAFSMWDGNSLFQGVLGCTLTIISSAIVERLPTWASMLLLILSIFYNAYVLVGMFLFPMIKQWMNVSVSTLISGAIFASLFQLFPIDSVYRLFIPLGLLFVLFPIYWFVFRRIRRKFSHLELDEADLTTERHCLRYLRIAIADRCADFVTFKWVRKMNQIDTTSVFCQVAQMISFFPTESQNLTFYISILSKRSDLSLHQRFLLFQLRRVHVLRQSNTSKQLNEDLEEISKATNQSIASFSQFLIRTIDERQELSLDSLAALARLNRTTSSLCHEAMARYPNNSRLLFIFARYVIECQADFKGGISLYQEGQLIDRGKRPSIDFAFRSMVNLFPNYLWKRILDYRGRSIINRRRQKSDSSLSIESQTNEKNIASETDVESNEKIASSVLENPKLRLSLKKAVSNMSSTGILIISLSWIIRILLSIVICFVVICVAPDFLGDRKTKFESIAQISAVRKSVDLSLFRMAKLWSLNLHLSPKQEDVTAALGPEVSLKEYNNITVDPKVALFSDVIDSINAIEKLGNLFVSIKYQESSTSENQSSDFTPTNTIYFCNLKTGETITSATSVLYFSLYLLNQAVTITNLPNTHSYEWKNEECICEIILNMQNILEAFNNQSGVLVNDVENNSTSMEKRIIIFFCIIIPIVFAAYIIPFIIGYVKMNSEFKQIFDVLNLLPIKIYKEASRPIAIFQSESDQSQDGISHVTSRGCQKVAIVIPVVLSSVIIAGSLIGIFFLILDVNVKFFTLVKWLEIGSRRTPLLIETVTNGILAGIFGYIGATEYTDHVVHLDNVFSYSQRLLYQHKILIWGSENSTSCNNFTRRLDDLHFTNTCAINNQGESLQISYVCMSLDQQIMTFNKFAKDAYLTMIYAQINSNTTNHTSSDEDDVNNAFLNILNGYEMINLHYLGITYLLPKLEEAQQILNELINLKIEQLKRYSIIIALCTLGAEIILFITEIFIINNLKDEYNIVRILIARLPPFSVVRNQSIVELITGQSDVSNSKNSTPIEIHIRYCSNPIIVFNKRCKIQLVNHATTEVFGFTKEQLFNAPLSTVIERENTLAIQDKCNRNNEHKDDQKGFKDLLREKIKKQPKKSQNEILNEYRNQSQQEAANEADLSFLLDDSDNDNIDLNTTTNSKNKNNNSDQKSSEKVDLYDSPVSMVLMGMKDDGTKIILKSVLTYLPPPDDVYVLIMRDETQIYINKNEITYAKLRANQIKMNVLPPEISQNEKIKENISFSLKLVSVITVRVINFNESVMNFTSVQAIRNMAELFTTFDEQLVKYQNLTKTLVISESYQAIGGLFNNKSIRKCTSVDDDEFMIDDEEATQEASTNRTDTNTENTGRMTPMSTGRITPTSTSRLTPTSTGRLTPTSTEKAPQNTEKFPQMTSEKAPQNTEKFPQMTSEKVPQNTEKFPQMTSEKVPQNTEKFPQMTSEKVPQTTSEKVPQTTSEKVPQTTSEKDQQTTPEDLNNNATNLNNSNEQPVNNNNTNLTGTSSESTNDTNKTQPTTTTNEDDEEMRKLKIKIVNSRKSIYDINSLSAQSANFADVVLDSIYFAFNCIDAADYINATKGTNFVLGIGINVGGPVTAGTLGKEHMQFEIVGEAVKTSFSISSAADPGTIVISPEVMKFIRGSEEAQRNLVFQRYKQVALPHQKATDTFIVRPSRALQPSSAREDEDEEDEEGNGDEEEASDK